MFVLLPSDTALVYRVSKFFGGTERTDAVGHVILFGLFTLSLYWMFNYHLSRQYACYAAVGCGLLIGTAFELLQNVIPARGASALDLYANWVGTLAALAGHLGYAILRRFLK